MGKCQILVQIFTVLPNPPDFIFRDIQESFYKFLWDGKIDKIKRNTIINEYDEGGLKMPHVQSFCYALKFSWLHKLLDPLNHSPWKILLLNSIQKFGGDNILHLGREGLETLAKKLNPFWRDIFLNFSRLKEKTEAVSQAEDVLSQSIWLNSCIKIDGKMWINTKCCENNVFFINDLISDHRRFYTFDEFQALYNIKLNFVEYYSIISAIPQSWKEKIIGKDKLDNITHPLVEKIRSEQKLCKYFYKMLIEKFRELPLNIQNRWGNDLNVKIENWNLVHKLPFVVTHNSKLQNFQYKLVHRIVSCNSFLYKCGLKETELCTFCSETKESLYHIFWGCNLVQNFWMAMRIIIKTCGVDLSLNAKDIILGSDIEDNCNLYNNIVLILKYYLHSCRCKGCIPTSKGGLEFLKYYVHIEKMSTMYMTPTKQNNIIRKWVNLEAVLSG